jgi:putative transposase
VWLRVEQGLSTKEIACVLGRNVNTIRITQRDFIARDKGKTLRVPMNIELAFLPPYAPELNPQEQVWDELREKYCGNKLFKSLEAVVDAVVEGLQHLETSPVTLTRLTQRSWMLNPN